MKKHISSATNYFKSNRVIMGAVIAAVVLTIGAIGYSQSHQSALQRKQLDAETKLASQIEDSKKANQAREAKIAKVKKDAAAEAAAKKAAEEKAAAEAAAKAEAEKQAQAAAAQQAEAAQGSSISLSLGTPEAYDGKTKVPFTWSAGFTSEKGFKIVWSTSPNPTYPNDNYHYTGENNSGGSAYAKIYTPGTYYFRACEYLGDGVCSGNYSNQVSVVVP